MNKIRFQLEGGAMRAMDAAYVTADEDPRETLVEAIVNSIATDLFVIVGGVRIHLAALMDPDHWDEDWKAAGVDDVDGLLAGAMTE